MSHSPLQKKSKKKLEVVSVYDNSGKTFQEIMEEAFLIYVKTSKAFNKRLEGKQ